MSDISSLSHPENPSTSADDLKPVNPSASEFEDILPPSDSESEQTLPPVLTNLSFSQNTFSDIQPYHSEGGPVGVDQYIDMITPNAAGENVYISLEEGLNPRVGVEGNSFEPDRQDRPFQTLSVSDNANRVLRNNFEGDLYLRVPLISTGTDFGTFTEENGASSTLSSTLSVEGVFPRTWRDPRDVMPDFRVGLENYTELVSPDATLSAQAYIFPDYMGVNAQASLGEDSWPVHPTASVSYENIHLNFAGESSQETIFKWSGGLDFPLSEEGQHTLGLRASGEHYRCDDYTAQEWKAGVHFTGSLPDPTNIEIGYSQRSVNGNAPQQAVYLLYQQNFR
jgi:hypothetical protein